MRPRRWILPTTPASRISRYLETTTAAVVRCRAVRRTSQEVPWASTPCWPSRAVRGYVRGGAGRRSSRPRATIGLTMSDNERKSSTDVSKSDERTTDVSKSDKRKQSLYFPEQMLEEI